MRVNVQVLPQKCKKRVCVEIFQRDQGGWYKKKTEYKQCPEVIIRYIGSSTSKMLRHIRRFHKIKLAKLVASGQVEEHPTMTPFVIKTADWKPNAKKTVEWDRKVLKFILSKNQSLSMVENPEFRDLLPKEYKPPCRKTLTNKCLSTCYLATKEKLLFDIQSNSHKYIGLQVSTQLQVTMIHTAVCVYST